MEDAIFKTNRSILRDLEKLSINNDIRNEAERVFRSLQEETKRAHKRKLLLAYCIYQAYQNMAIPILPSDLAKIIGIKESEIGKALNMFSPLQTKYNPPKITWEAKDFIPAYCEKCGINAESVPTVIRFTEFTVEQKPFLNELKPQDAALGCLYHFIQMNDGGLLTLKDFASRVGITVSALNRISNEFSRTK